MADRLRLDILGLIHAGRSPWDGWDRAVPAWNAKAKAAAYARRRDAIQACRAAGLVTVEGLLTEAGRAMIAAATRTEASVG